jgi:chromosome segregation ATPase
MRAAAQSQAMEAGERVEALASDLEAARSRVDALEVEVAGLREQWSLAEARLSTARETISTALALLEEMQRREEMTSSMRARSVRDTLHALGRGAADAESKAPPSDRASGPESSVEIVGTHDMDWDLDFAEPE